MNRRTFIMTFTALAAMWSNLEGAAAARPPRSRSIVLLASPLSFDIARKSMRIFHRTGSAVALVLPRFSDRQFREELGMLVSETLRGQEELGRQATIVLLQTAGDPYAFASDEYLSTLDAPFVRIIENLYADGGSYPSRTVLRFEDRGKARSLEVPSFWHQQFWLQVSRAPTLDGYHRHERDVEEQGRPIVEIFENHESMFCMIAAHALHWVAQSPSGLRAPSTPIAAIDCIVDKCGLARTDIDLFYSRESRARVPLLT